MENKWIITEKEKNKYMNNLTNELAVLRAKVGIPQEDISKIIGISRQTYGEIERKKRKMSWNTYLSLILFFDYNESTHQMIRTIQAFPHDIINRFNNSKEKINIYNKVESKSKEFEVCLDERALHAIKTIIMLEYARCNEKENKDLIESIEDKKIFQEICKINNFSTNK